MLIILHDHYASPEKLAEQMDQLRLLPGVGRVAMVSKLPDTARKHGLKWLPETQTGGIARLLKLADGKPLLKINDTQAISHATLSAFLDSHRESNKPVSVFCPGPNDFTHSPMVLAELYDPAIIGAQKVRDKISASLKIKLRNFVKAHVGNFAGKPLSANL